MRSLDLILRLSGLTIFMVVSGIFIRRKLYVQFPFFSVYVAFSPTATLLRLFLRHHPAFYFWMYWATEAGYSILALLTLNEVFRRLYELEYEDHGWFKLLIPATTVIVLVTSMWGAIYSPPDRPIPFLVSGIFWFDLGVHWLEVGILLLLVVLALFFTLPRSRYEVGILAGFAVSASSTLLADLIRSRLGPSYEAWFQYGPPIGYLFAALIWLYGFWKPPARPDELRVKALLPFDEFHDHHDGSVQRYA